MRYYDLDLNGKVKGHYAVPQPEKVLHLLPIAPDDMSMRDGVPGENWIPDQDAINLTIKEEALAKLQEIDLKSIRSLREYVSNKTDAPQYLKDYESQAIAEREKSSGRL